MNDGYSEIDSVPNEECFIFFYQTLKAILENIQKHDSINQKYIGIDVSRFLRLIRLLTNQKE